MTRWDRRPWSNWLGNVYIRRPERHYRPSRLPDLVEIVRDAERHVPPKRVRACGSHWALSDVAASPDWFVETSKLDATLAGVIPQALSARARDELAANPHGSGHGFTYYHVEAGVMISELSERLDAEPARRWALPTMGGAAGQTLAGAVSTGTHGGDHQLPPMADYVATIHLVTSNGRQVWIEPEDGITDPALLSAALPGVTQIRRTAAFEAALVAVGRIGIIYALVIKVVEQFSLTQVIVTSTWEEQQALLRPPFPVFQAPPPDGPGPTTATHFIEVVLGPYADKGRHACYVTRRWIGPDMARLPPPRPTLFGLICEHRWLLSWPWRISVGDIVAAVCNAANRLGQSWFVRWLGERLLSLFRPLTTVRDVGYHIMDLGRSGANCYRGNSLEVAFDATAGDHVDFVNDDLFPLFEHMAGQGLVVGGYVSLRFTRRSRGTPPATSRSRCCRVCEATPRSCGRWRRPPSHAAAPCTGASSIR
jgi:FAD binding domain